MADAPPTTRPENKQMITITSNDVFIEILGAVNKAGLVWACEVLAREYIARGESEDAESFAIQAKTLRELGFGQFKATGTGSEYYDRRWAGLDRRDAVAGFKRILHEIGDLAGAKPVDERDQLYADAAVWRADCKILEEALALASMKVGKGYSPRSERD